MKELKSHLSFSGRVVFCEQFSDITKTNMKFSMFYPSQDVEIKGGVIWLSGLTCTDENFIAKAGAQKTLNELGLVLICPDTSPRGLSLPGENENYDFGSGASFYLDAVSPGYKDHYLMHRYIVEEIYSVLKGVIGSEKKISLMGHSMGGHGALVLGLKNPGLFSSVSAFSPIVNPSQCPWGQKAFTGYLGDDIEDWKLWDTCELLKAGNRHPNQILISQGLNDEFFEKQLLTANFEKYAKEANQDFIVDYCKDYDHSYYFIASFIEKHLRHHANYLS